jgi:hypothetical protein
MKYRFWTKFWYDEDDEALARRLLAFFESPFFRGAILKPRSLRLAPTQTGIAKLLEPDGYLNSDFDWVVKRDVKPISGRLSITRNRIWTPPGFTSVVELRFSLSKGYKGGPFHCAEEIRDAGLACMVVGPSQIGVVEAEDEDYARSKAKFERFRKIDDMAVPVSIEWVTILHRDIVSNMSVDIRRAEGIAGVQVGETGHYWWVILCPEPFSFASGVGVPQLQRVTEVLGLSEIHTRFKQSSK